jgi:prepilin-type N-terminal cleavage/methylation domain-containing protein
MNRRSKYVNEKGFTLVEMVMVIVILGVIGAFTFQFVAHGVQAFKKSSARKDLYDQGRLALERMVRELRDGKEITDCTSNSMTFKKAHPAQAADNIEEIKYELDGTDLKRVGDPNGNEGGPYEAVLASDVTSFQMGEVSSGSLTVDAVSSGTTSGGSSITISHTTGSGSDRLMLVGVSMNNDGYETVTGVTYNGTALTLVGSEATTDDARVEIWRLVAPSTGTHNVVITFSAALLQEAHAGVMTFAGVDQTTPLGTFVSANHDASTPATVDIPSASGELVFGVVASEYEALTASSGQDERWNLSVSSTYGAGGTAAGAAPTVTMSWNLDAAQHWAMGGVSIKPSGSSGPIVCAGGGGSITFDAASSATSGSSPLSWSHTVGSGNNRLLVVSMGIEGDSTVGNVTGVTYNTVALTKAVENFVGDYQNTEIWYLLNPPEGSANVEVTTNGDPGDINGGAISVFGADQSGPEATNSKDDGVAGWTTIQTNITTLTDGAWVFDVVGSGEPRTFTADAGQTERFDQTGGSDGAAGSTEQVSTAGTATLGWTVDGTSNRLSHVLAAFAPAADSSPLQTVGLTLSSEQGGTVTMRTKVFMRNVP